MSAFSPSGFSTAAFSVAAFAFPEPVVESRSSGGWWWYRQEEPKKKKEPKPAIFGIEAPIFREKSEKQTFVPAEHFRTVGQPKLEVVKPVVAAPVTLPVKSTRRLRESDELLLFF